MVKFQQANNHFWRKFLLRSLLVIATSAAILWFLPRTEGRIYHYDVDKI